jgi:hypothetical protein
MTDNHGYVLSPLPVAPVNETDMVLLPKGLQALKKVAKQVGLDLRGAYLNLVVALIRRTIGSACSMRA